VGYDRDAVARGFLNQAADDGDGPAGRGPPLELDGPVVSHCAGADHQDLPGADQVSGEDGLGGFPEPRLVGE
jgi:hypothetical protein